MIASEPITLYELLTLIVSIGGFATVIVTIILLIKQTKEIATQTKYVAESLRSSAYGVIAAQVFDTDKIFIDCPELRPIFYSSKDVEENDPLYNKAMAVAEFILDYFESALLQNKYFPQVWPIPVWEEYIIDSFAQSPVLCRYLSSKKGWYVDKLVDLMEQGEARRQKATDAKAN